MFNEFHVRHEPSTLKSSISFWIFIYLFLLSTHIQLFFYRILLLFVAFKSSSQKKYIEWKNKLNECCLLISMITNVLTWIFIEKLYIFLYFFCFSDKHLNTRRYSGCRTCSNFDSWHKPVVTTTNSPLAPSTFLIILKIWNALTNLY